jgi:hypothetical protein
MRDVAKRAFRLDAGEKKKRATGVARFVKSVG